MSFDLRYLRELLETIEGSRGRSPGYAMWTFTSGSARHDKEKPSTRAGVLTPFCPCLFPGRRPDRVLAGREKNQ